MAVMYSFMAVLIIYMKHHFDDIVDFIAFLSLKATFSAKSFCDIRTKYYKYYTIE